ncbi:hypothetical protein COO60DRAFT_1485562, partial [Scenedesmus sp. NREL 46B-D3]
MKHVYVMLVQSTYVLVGSLSLFVPAAPLQALHPAQITAAIRDCSTAEQLVALIQQHVGGMNAINLAAAITQLSRLRCRQRQPYTACLEHYMQLG